MGHFFHIPCAWYLLTMQEAAGHKCWPPSFDCGKFLAAKEWVWKPAKHAAAPITVSKHMPVSGRSFYLLSHRAGFVNAGNYWSPEYTVLVNVLFIIHGLFPEVVKMHSYKIGQYICLSEADGSGSKNAAQNGSAAAQACRGPLLCWGVKWLSQPQSTGKPVHLANALQRHLSLHPSIRILQETFVAS